MTFDKKGPDHRWNARRIRSLHYNSASCRLGLAGRNAPGCRLAETVDHKVYDAAAAPKPSTPSPTLVKLGS